MAPTIYITGNPARTDTVTRNFGRALSNLTATSPYTGLTDHLSVALADPIGMKALHMVTADPQRTPTLTMFAHPDYFFFAGAPNCNSPCVTVPTTPPTSTFAWNHGGIQPEIAQTWLGVVGPGVRSNDVDGETWLDHTDVRPTMLCLVGLKDSYRHDGRVLTEALDFHERGCSLGGHAWTLNQLARTYKQLNAPFGQLGMDALKISTDAVASNASGDAAYNTLEGKLDSWTGRRDDLAGPMKTLLDRAPFDDDRFGHGFFDGIVALWLTRQARILLDEVHFCAANTTVCAQ
jgi:hypothetical protein